MGEQRQPWLDKEHTVGDGVMVVNHDRCHGIGARDEPPYQSGQSDAALDLGKTW